MRLRAEKLQLLHRRAIIESGAVNYFMVRAAAAPSALHLGFFSLHAAHRIMVTGYAMWIYAYVNRVCII
jgi:hypothetical protein